MGLVSLVPRPAQLSVTCSKRWKGAGLVSLVPRPAQLSVTCSKRWKGAGPGYEASYQILEAAVVTKSWEVGYSYYIMASYLTLISYPPWEYSAVNIIQLFAFCFVIASKRYRYEFRLVSKHFKWEINFYILYNVGCMGWLVGKILTLIFCIPNIMIVYRCVGRSLTNYPCVTFLDTR